jgi:hypothetical protein
MAAPNSRTTLIDYCLRNLGSPVLEVNVDPDQLEDRVDEAIQYYQNFHSDATLRTFLKHQVTTTDVTNEYITLSASIQNITKMFNVHGSAMSRNFFDIKYQMHLNDMRQMHGFIGELAYYEQMQQYLSTLDMKLNGTPQVQFSRMQNRLYIHGEFQDGDLKAGDYLVAEIYEKINPDTFTNVYNDLWLKEYTTALIKRQWGANLMKFEGMQLPGGVMINGRQLYDDGEGDIARLRESIRLEHEMPTDFFVG